MGKTQIKNKLRDFDGVIVGGSSETKLGVLLGITSQNVSSRAHIEQAFATELEKAKTAVDLGVSTLTDVSTWIPTGQARVESRSDFLFLRLLKDGGLGRSVAIGSVPAYEICARALRDPDIPLSRIVVDTLTSQAQAGVDFFSIHLSLSRPLVSRIRDTLMNRTIPIQSRGGNDLLKLMTRRRCENPLFEFRDEVARIAYEYGITLSFISSFRPGSVCDAKDFAHCCELETMKAIIDEPLFQPVKSMIELLNHARFPDIQGYCDFHKRLFGDMPFGALGPSPTDVAVTYDHAVGAMGAAFAMLNGVSWINVVTSREHLGIPSKRELREAIFHYLHAHHAVHGSSARDAELSIARSNLQWQEIIELSIDPQRAQEVIAYSDGEPCTMCGGKCPHLTDIGRMLERLEDTEPGNSATRTPLGKTPESDLVYFQ